MYWLLFIFRVFVIESVSFNFNIVFINFSLGMLIVVSGVILDFVVMNLIDIFLLL